MPWVINWIAQYNDKSEFPQYLDGKERSYEHLDRSKVVSFALYDRETKQTILVLHLEPGQQLIYRRRVEMKLGSDIPVEVCYLLGWRRTIRLKDGTKECVQSIAYVFEKSKRIELAGEFREGHSWFYAPVFRDFERMPGDPIQSKQTVKEEE